MNTLTVYLPYNSKKITVHFRTSNSTAMVIFGSRDASREVKFNTSNVTG